MTLSITNRHYSPAGLIHELVNELPVGEQLRLLAWANTPRMDELSESGLRQKSKNDLGPGLDDEPVITMAMSSGRL